MSKAPGGPARPADPPQPQPLQSREALLKLREQDPERLTALVIEAARRERARVLRELWTRCACALARAARRGAARVRRLIALRG